MEYKLIDILIILLVVFGALQGYRVGFFGSIAKFFGSLFAFLFSFKFYKLVVQALEANFKLVSSLSEFLGEKINLPLEVGSLPINADSIYFLRISISQIPLPASIKDLMIYKVQELMRLAGQLGLATTGELLTYLIALTVINILIIILLWLLTRKAILVICEILTKSMGQGIFGPLNHFSGFLIGGLVSGLGLMITFGLLNMLLETIYSFNFPIITFLADYLRGSHIVAYLLQGYDLLLTKIMSFI